VARPVPGAQIVEWCARVSAFSLLRFDTGSLPADERFAAFASGIANFDVTPATDGPFAAQAVAWKVGALVIGRLSSDAIRYERTEARTLSDAIDHFYVNFHATGEVAADAGAGLVRGGPGSLLVIDMRQPCAMEVRGARISIAVPRQLLLPHLRSHDPHGLVATDGLAQLLGRSLYAAARSLPGLAARHAPAVERMLVAQIGETLRDVLQSGDARRSRQELLVGRVRAYVDAHLAEPLDAAAICAALGVSRSSLYRAMADRGGVQRYLRERRLRRVRALLETPGETRPLAALAELTGFADKAHLSRAYKRAFGVTPGDVRARTAQRPPHTAAAKSEASKLFRGWVSALD
jgi:AraC-like DNA-binding protein